MQSLKEDKQFQHSTFLEYTIVFLIAFEVIVELHALGWIDWPPWMRGLVGQRSHEEPEELAGYGSHGKMEARGAKLQIISRKSES